MTEEKKKLRLNEINVSSFITGSQNSSNLLGGNSVPVGTCGGAFCRATDQTNCEITGCDDCATQVRCPYPPQIPTMDQTPIPCYV